MIFSNKEQHTVSGVMGICPIKPYIYKPCNGNRSPCQTGWSSNRGFLVFLPAAPPHNSPPPKKADNTVPSKAWTEVQDARVEIMDFIHHWPIILQPCCSNRSSKKMGRPACLNANIWGRWKTHIRYHPPQWIPWPCPTESHVPCQWWPLRYLNDPFLSRPHEAVSTRENNGV